MRYVGLDLSATGAGIAVVDDAGALLEAARAGYGLPRGAAPAARIERLVAVATAVVQAVRRHQAAGVVVGIEQYAFHARGAVADLGEVGGAVKTQLMLALGVAPVLVVASAARKVVLGRGRVAAGPAGKREILTTLAARGLPFADHNQADAYVIAEYLRRTADAEVRNEKG